MSRRLAIGATLSLLFAGMAAAQDTAPKVTEAPQAELRWLDRLSGETDDLILGRGQAVQRGRLTIQLDSCRYLADNPAAEAYAHLTITDRAAAEPVFSGWMVASSPALSALDHPRYDVWVLRCVTD